MAAATIVFRQQGYEATSVDDLVAATGVHRASLYGVFGSKYGLFRRALDQDLSTGEESTDQHPGDLDLALVALLELAPSDDAVRALIAAAVEAERFGPEMLGSRLLQRAGVLP